MGSRLIRRAAALAAATSLVALSVCSSSTPSAGGDGAGKGRPVTIDFWGWAPGYKKSVDLFNATHDNIKVDFNKIARGTKGGYTKMLSALKAGNGPCLAAVGYESLPTFAVAGALQDVTEEASRFKLNYVPWAFNQAAVGGKWYGLPVDIAPMALIYRKDLFARYGITRPPRTWQEYAEDAAKIHAANPKAYIGYFGNDAYNFAGLAWQAGAKWFDTADNQWTVSVDDAATLRVANFWQRLINNDLVKSVPSFDTGLYKGIADGSILSDVNAVWDTPIVSASVSETAGKWAVAPMPVWDESNPTSGNAGGSPNVVLKGCRHAKEAVDCAHWFSTDPQSVTNLVKETGIYPAAFAAQNNPALSKPDPFYGGQKIFDVFRDAAQLVDPSFQWGPAMIKTSEVLGDGLSGAGWKETTLPHVLARTTAETESEMQRQQLAVRAR